MPPLAALQGLDCGKLQLLEGYPGHCALHRLGNLPRYAKSDVSVVYFRGLSFSGVEDGRR